MKKTLTNIIVVLFISHLLSDMNRISASEEQGTKYREFCSADFDSVNINLDEGDISVTGTTDTKTKITWVEKSFGSNCALKMDVFDRVLKIDCKKMHASDKCTVDFTINVPSPTHFKINVGMSKINMKGITGSFDLNMGSGFVDLKSPLSGIRCDLGNGNLSILYTSLPKRFVPININGGRINFDITLPHDSIISHKTNSQPVVTVTN